MKNINQSTPSQSPEALDYLKLSKIADSELLSLPVGSKVVVAVTGAEPQFTIGTVEGKGKTFTRVTYSVKSTNAPRTGFFSTDGKEEGSLRTYPTQVFKYVEGHFEKFRELTEAAPMDAIKANQ